VQHLDVPAAPDMDPAIAPVWHAVEFARPRVITLIKGLSPEQLAARPPGFSNSLASLVVHCAGANTSFAAAITGQAVPSDLQSKLYLDQPSSPIYQPDDETVDSLEEKWEDAHAYLRSAVASITSDSVDRVIPRPGGYSFTLRWLLALITFHTPDHYGQMVMIKQHLD